VFFWRRWRCTAGGFGGGWRGWRGLIAAQWGAKLAGGQELAQAAGVLNGVFFLYVISRLAMQVAGARKVTRLVLLEAVNVYLLIGLVFSLLAAVTAGAWPGYFTAAASGAALDPVAGFHDFVYYAFITMATVGYGDIVPATDPARALAVLMAVTGPLYMALVIAVLVGKYAGTSERNADDA
jgi:voltage-gated potassium channel